MNSPRQKMRPVADEFDLIAEHFEPLSAGAPGALGLRDDAALIAPKPGYDLVVTMDTVVEGVHFLGDETATNIAAKLAGSNLSDLAAMGAHPAGFTLSCAWHQDEDQSAIAEFAKGLQTWVEAYDFPAIGGDTVTTSGPRVFTMTAFGHVATGCAIRRNGALPGDGVYVTGTIGDAALGLRVARGELTPDTKSAAFLEQRYRRPEPRVSAGIACTGQVNAGIDVSDGLVQDLGHIAKQSGVQITILLDQVPLSAAAASVLHGHPEHLHTVLGGGDDYELAFCTKTPPDIDDVQVTLIGQVSAGPSGVKVLNKSGATMEIKAAGYNHFT